VSQKTVIGKIEGSTFELDLLNVVGFCFCLSYFLINAITRACLKVYDFGLHSDNNKVNWHSINGVLMDILYIIHGELNKLLLLVLCSK